MISFFQSSENKIFAVETANKLSPADIEKLAWLFSNAQLVEQETINGTFVGPRREMITPWSTNAVEITQNMGIAGILRIEEFSPLNPPQGDLASNRQATPLPCGEGSGEGLYDPMLQRIYENLNQNIFTITKTPEPIIYIDDIAAYNEQEGLALSNDEIDYLNSVSKKYGRKLTDSEVFGFSQVNSEHCRHKIFNGIFVIDGEEKESSLFKLIKKTSEENPNDLVSAYKDNVAFNQGPEIEQFAPASGDKPDFFQVKKIESVISLKAETHNFPTTVEPFNGASTGSGGEIRDRLGGGKASLPIAGTAVYMTSYPRTEKDRAWEKPYKERKWLYQTPEQILIKASNGASDFGNKFGQPLICGSLLTFEHNDASTSLSNRTSTSLSDRASTTSTTLSERSERKQYGYDKVIMLAGGVGFAKKSDALKGNPEPGEKVVVLGGDNYRIGMGGGAVSSVDTGQYSSGIELNAVQRANPEMQKRVANVIRTLAESDDNPIVSIHDHGAGGHLNCLSELVEATGGKIEMDKLPIGDPTLSAKEIVGNESQERMGLLVPKESLEKIKKIAERERSPFYEVGETTGDMRLVFASPPAPQRGELGRYGYQTAHIANYEILKQNAKYHKTFSTDAEYALWGMLSAKKLESKFRRQHIIDMFIVDFVCLDKKLVIEVDGGYHNKKEVAEYDKMRTEILNDLGYRVIRFTNEEVLSNADAVLNSIKTTLQLPPLGGGGANPIDMALEDFFGKAPKTYMRDETVTENFSEIEYSADKIQEYIENVLQLEGVACKDWLTNKVDRSVTGKVARQQCVGEIQLPLSDLGAVALDYNGTVGIATSIGHAPQAALIDPAAGSVLAIAEALTNIVFAPLKNGLASVSLSANWMWPCKNKGEDARLYKAVEACSDFACALGINIPTGKDSLSMTQKYSPPAPHRGELLDGQQQSPPEGDLGGFKVLSPGTVIISAGAEVSDVKKIVSPVLVNDKDTYIYYIDFSFDTFKLGGSAFAQSLDRLGNETPTVKDAEYFADVFNAVQTLINKNLILAGHDISAGGMLTALLEMCFANKEGGLKISPLNPPQGDFADDRQNWLVKFLFAENPGILIQIKDTKSVEKILKDSGIAFAKIAQPIEERKIKINFDGRQQSLPEGDLGGLVFDIDILRDLWFKTSYLLDRKQSGEICAKARFENYKKQPLQFKFSPPTPQRGELPNGRLQPKGNLTDGCTPPFGGRGGSVAAIIREKGTNGEREMAYSLYLAGFDVKDVHMTDLASGRETLENVNFIVFCGGFSNSDVLGSAKGWAGGFLYNEKAKKALDNFYKRPDTLSLGICNGCQLMVELENLPLTPSKRGGKVSPFGGDLEGVKMLHNDSHKFESEFIGIDIPENNSVMFGSLAGSKLGIWVAHGEGKFHLPKAEKEYHIVAKYSYGEYPANPNGSDYNVAGIASADGRHLAMMPHLERAIFPWQWAHYPLERKNSDLVTPWVEAFVNARKWVEKKMG